MVLLPLLYQKQCIVICFKSEQVNSANIIWLDRIIINSFIYLHPQSFEKKKTFAIYIGFNRHFVHTQPSELQCHAYVATMRAETFGGHINLHPRTSPIHFIDFIWSNRSVKCRIQTKCVLSRFKSEKKSRTTKTATSRFSPFRFNVI